MRKIAPAIRLAIIQSHLRESMIERSCGMVVSGVADTAVEISEELCFSSILPPSLEWPESGFRLRGRGLND